MKHGMRLLVPLLCALMVNCDTIIHSDEERIMTDIFNGYNPTPRPVFDSNTTIQVSLKLQITNVVELNTKDQFLKLRGWITVEWKDEFLTWNISDYGGQEVIVVRPHKIWLPAFSPDNKLRGSIYDKQWFKLFRASVYSDGTVIWEPGGQFLSECETDIAYFPFDEQICVVTFSNWVYNVKQVNLSIHENAMDEILELFQANSQWSVEDLHIRRKELYYSCCEEPYPEINYVFHLKRKFLFYFVNLIYVSLLLAVLVVITTKVPPETGERIILGVSTLLAYIIFIIVAHNYVPSTSQAVPVIVIYFVISMFVNGLALAESAFSAHCYYRRNKRRAPQCLRAFVLGFLLRVMCYPKIQHQDSDTQNVNDELKKRKKSRKRSRINELIKKFCRAKQYDLRLEQESSNGEGHLSPQNYQKFQKRKRSVGFTDDVLNKSNNSVVRRTSPSTELNEHTETKNSQNHINQCEQSEKSLCDSIESTSFTTISGEESEARPDDVTRVHSAALAENGCLPTTHLPADVITSIIEHELERRQSQQQLSSIMEENESVTSGGSKNGRINSLPQIIEPDENDGGGSDSDASDVDYDYINAILDSNHSISSAFSTAYQTSAASSLTQASVRTAGLYHQPSTKEERKFQRERSLIRNLNASMNVPNAKVWANLKKENPALNLIDLQKEISRLNVWYEEQEQIRKVKREWIYIAQTLDLFFFWFLLCLYSLIIIVLLILLPNLVTVKINQSH